MEFKEVQKYLKDNAGTDEVKNYIKGLTTVDSVNEFLNSDAGIKVMQPRLDSNFTKGLETWKTNNLDKITSAEVEKVIKAKYPEETEADKRLRKLELDLTTETGKRIQAEMLMSATADANTKGLPIGLTKYFVGKDAEGTKAGLLDFETSWKGALKSAIENEFKKNGRSPDSGLQKEKEKQGLYTFAQVDKMSQAEVTKNLDKVLLSQKSW